jgi:hypothetical protein
MDLSSVECIHRFLFQVLPKLFIKIRYCCFLANVCKQKAIALIRRLIGKYLAVATFACENPREKMLRLTGRDILLCPSCRQGMMQPAGIFYRDREWTELLQEVFCSNVQSQPRCGAWWRDY